MSNITYKDYGVRFKGYVSPFTSVKLNTPLQSITIFNKVPGTQLIVPPITSEKQFFGGENFAILANNRASITIPRNIPIHYNLPPPIADNSKIRPNCFNPVVINNPISLVVNSSPLVHYWENTIPSDIETYINVSRVILTVRGHIVPIDIRPRDWYICNTKFTIVANNVSMTVQPIQKPWSNTTQKDSLFKITYNKLTINVASNFIKLYDIRSLENYFSHPANNVTDDFYTVYVNGQHTTETGPGGVTLIDLNLISGKPCSILLSSSDNSSTVTIKSIEGLPSNLSFNDGTNTIEGIPMVSGRYDCNIVLSNDNKIVLTLNINPLSLFTGI